MPSTKNSAPEYEVRSIMSPFSNVGYVDIHSQVGDHVEYQAIGGGNVQNSTTTGEITEVVTSKAPAGETGVKVNVSPLP